MFEITKTPLGIQTLARDGTGTSLEPKDVLICDDPEKAVAFWIVPITEIPPNATSIGVGFGKEPHNQEEGNVNGVYCPASTKTLN